MPKKNYHGYSTPESDFYSKFRGRYGEVTPKMYKDHLEEFIKSTDSEYIINNFAYFINWTANGIINKGPHDPDRLIAPEYSGLYPYELFEDYLIKNRPTEKLVSLLKQNCTKAAYTQLCNNALLDLDPKMSENAKLEYRLNQMKTIEALKPTGNAFTTFFKRLFNINGYNDKMRTYENAKTQIRNEIGEKMTDEQFLDCIAKYEYPASSAEFKKDSKVSIKIDELNPLNDVRVKESDKVKQVELVDEKVKIK